MQHTFLSHSTLSPRQSQLTGLNAAPATESQTAHRAPQPMSYLHVDKGPQVPPWQPQEQLNQGRVGSLYSQVQNGLVALDLLRREEP